MYYAALYNHGSMSRFLGFSSNEYIAKLYADSDDLSNIYIEEYDCSWEEFCRITNNLYIDGSIDNYDDRLQIMTSMDEETYMVSSPKGLEELIYESGFVDTLVEHLAETLVGMLYMSPVLNEDDISRFVYYIIQIKYPPIAKAYQKGLLCEHPNYHLDLIKALANQGFVGTVK